MSERRRKKKNAVYYAAVGVDEVGARAVLLYNSVCYILLVPSHGNTAYDGTTLIAPVCGVHTPGEGEVIASALYAAHLVIS